jgi:hypothetical protein
MYPPVATPVWFYPNADTARPPQAAIVLDSYANGVLRLALLGRGGGDIKVAATVYPVGHDLLTDDSGRPTSNAIRNGAWDFHPWFQPPAAPCCQPAEDMELDAVKPESQEGRVNRVMALAAEHQFDAVCKKVRSLGLSRSDVAAIYKENELTY